MIIYESENNKNNENKPLIDTGNLSIHYVFDTSEKFKKSISVSMIECQMNVIKKLYNQISKLCMLDKTQSNLDKIHALQISLLYEKHKIIEYLGNIEPITLFKDFKKIRAIKQQCSKIHDHKFVLITSALIDILFEYN